ncbi:site-specific DNA-methyltransferase, partial [Burkholderia pseudomallei]
MIRAMKRASTMAARHTQQCGRLVPRAHFHSRNTMTIHATDAAPAADL